MTPADATKAIEHVDKARRIYRDIRTLRNTHKTRIEIYDADADDIQYPCPITRITVLEPPEYLIEVMIDHLRTHIRSAQDLGIEIDTSEFEV